jgi:hypothetical protein
MSEVKVLIKGATWTVKKLSLRKFNSLHQDKDCPALTIPIDREIHLNEKLYTPHFIRHELFHAYVAESNTESMRNMTIDDMEELSASIIAEYCFDIAKLADSIFTTFKTN